MWTSRLPRTKRHTRRERRRGAIAVLVAVILPVLIFIIGFAVDAAYMQLVRTELQSATDASARAAALELSKSGDKDDAIAEGIQVAQSNNVAGDPLQLETANFVFGQSLVDPSGRWVFTPDASPPNAVQVTGSRAVNSPGGPVALLFGDIMGVPSFQPVQTATAAFVDVDIALVLDRSSSMKLYVTERRNVISIRDWRVCRPPRGQSRWRALVRAVDVFIDALNDSPAIERVGLVTYSSNFRYCRVSTPESRIDGYLAEDLNRVRSSMNRLSTSVWNGNTHIDAGIRRGTTVLTDRSRARPLAEKVMILFTDGHYTNRHPLSDAVAASNHNITIHTITFSTGANQHDMRQVADATGGDHYHADTSEELEDIFEELAARLVRITD